MLIQPRQVKQGQAKPPRSCAPKAAPVACAAATGDPRVITILYEIVNEILNLYKWVVIFAAIFVTLVSFGVLDTRNRIVWTIGDFLYRLTEPALRPIRNFLPNFGGLDLSPIVLLILIWAVQQILQRVFVCAAYGVCNQLVF